MAINPFPRFTPLEVNPAVPAPRLDPSVFSNIAGIGDTIAAYRDRQAMGEILRGAVDPQTGNIDLQKAATAIATSGRDPVKWLTLLEAQQRAKEAQSYRQQALDISREGRDIQREQLDRPTQQVVPPSLMNPGGVYTIPRKPDQPPSFRPFPQGSTPAPQSMAPDIPGAPGPVAAAEFNPEEAPPYQVAGPPTPPPQQAAPVPAPAAEKPARNEAVLQRLPPAAQTIVRGVAEYEIDPSTLTGRDREEAIAAAKLYRPDYSMSEYQKRGSPPSGEVASRIGLAKGFLDSLPQIKARVQADEINTFEGRVAAAFGQGRAGELKAAVDEGADALLRGLTGAGMPETEAARYARRYGMSPTDTKETQLRKLNGLEKALRYVTTEVGKGRGGEDVLKGYRSQFGEEVIEKPAVPKVKNDAEVNRIVDQARQALARDPTQRNEIYKRMRDRGVPNPEVLLGQ